MNTGSAKLPRPSSLSTSRVTSRYMRLKQARPSPAGVVFSMNCMRAIASAIDVTGACGTDGAADIASLYGHRPAGDQASDLLEMGAATPRSVRKAAQCTHDGLHPCGYRRDRPGAVRGLQGPRGGIGSAVRRPLCRPQRRGGSTRGELADKAVRGT